MSYDLIVVGAGPAGSTAARFAAKAGLKVALIDKRSKIGFPKQCAEGINTHGMEIPGVKIRKDWISNTIYAGLIGLPGKGGIHIISKEPKGYILERKVFDAALADLAADAGADLIKSSPVVGLEKDNTVVRVKNSKNLKTKIVIGGDGPGSIVGKTSGLGNPISGIGMQYEIKAESKYPNTLQAYFSRDIIDSGYSWVFPKKDTLNVGIGSYKQEALKAKLDNFVKAVGVKGKILETNGGLIPLHGPLAKFYSNNVMLVGDAAGHTNPLTGGGIPVGMFDGKLAAKIAIEELESGKMDFSRYQDEWWNSKFGWTTKKSLVSSTRFLKCLNKGYIDAFLKKIGYIELKSSKDFPKILYKVMNPWLMFQLFLTAKDFPKIQKYAW